MRRGGSLLQERQLDDLGGDLAADGEPVPDLRFAPDDRQRDRTQGGGEAGASDPADLALAEQERLTGLGGAAQPEPPQRAVRLATVVQARHRLLPDVAALLEVDRPLHDADLGGHRLGPHVEAEAGPPGLDPEDLCRLLADLGDAGVAEQLLQPLELVAGFAVAYTSIR